MSQARTWSLVQALAGRWTGLGQGRFPTITSFAYREELVFRAHGRAALLHMEQITWLVQDGITDAYPQHWESGFLQVTEDGGLMLSNAQNHGRVEVLTGSAALEGDQLVLTLRDAVLANDAPMRASTRVFRLAGNTLTYEMGMATDRVAALTAHLSASLTRADEA